MRRVVTRSRCPRTRAASSAMASVWASAISASETSCSMPASASASSSSASRASAEICSVTLTMRSSSSASSVVPDGRSRSLARIWVPAGSALDRDLEELGDVGGLGLDGDDGVLVDDQRVGAGLAHDVDRDVDGDLLAADDGDEVEVLDDAADRVDLDVLGQRELLGAVDVEREERVGATVLEGHHRLVAGQDHVDRLVAVAVDDGGDLVVAADAAGGALAELGARLGGDLLGGRHRVLRTGRCRVVGGPRRSGDDERRAPDRERGAVMRSGPVDHGVPDVDGLPRRGNPGTLDPARVRGRIAALGTDRGAAHAAH